MELSQRSGADYFSNVVCFNLCEETDDPMSRGRTYAKNLRILRSLLISVRLSYAVEWVLR